MQFRHSQVKSGGRGGGCVGGGVEWRETAWCRGRVECWGAGLFFLLPNVVRIFFLRSRTCLSFLFQMFYFFENRGHRQQTSQRQTRPVHVFLLQKKKTSTSGSMVHALRNAHSLLPSRSTDEHRRACSWAWTSRLRTPSLTTVTPTRSRRNRAPVHGTTCAPPQPSRGAALPFAPQVYTFDPGDSRDLAVPSEPCVFQH